MPPDTPPLDASPRPRTVCRRTGCANRAAHPLGFCARHARRYERWRTERDELEAADLAGRGYTPRDPLGAATADALDALYKHLTPGPF